MKIGGAIIHTHYFDLIVELIMVGFVFSINKQDAAKSVFGTGRHGMAPAITRACGDIAWEMMQRQQSNENALLCIWAK